jgi:hypothetical protein
MATSKKRLGTNAEEGKTPVPDNQAATGRTPEGKFAPGFSGNPKGRPKALDFRALVNEMRGPSMAERLMRVFDVLEERALDGDTKAIQLLLDRICTPESQKLEIDHSGEIKGANGPAIPATDDLLKGIDQLRALAQEHFGQK